jgi:hypothetical protein
MKKTTTGTGITQRPCYSLGDEPITNVEPIRAFFEAIKEGRYRSIHNKACKILTEAGLPISWAVRYQPKYPEKWKPMPRINVCQPTPASPRSLRKCFEDSWHC